MWSASSRTVISTSSRAQCRCADQVLEATGAGDDDVDAAAQRLHLRVLADAAEDRLVVRPAAPASGSIDVVDLAGELAGRREDQRAGRPGRRWRPDAVRRATSGSTKAKVLPEPVRPRPSTSRPGEGVGQRGGLDGERGGDALRGQDGGQLGGTPRSAKEGTAEDKGDSLTCGVSHHAGHVGDVTGEAGLTRRGAGSSS